MKRQEALRVVSALTALHVPHVLVKEPHSTAAYHLLVKVPAGDVVLSDFEAAEKWCLDYHAGR